MTYLRACLALLVASLAFVCGIVAASFLCGLRSPDAKSVVAVLGRLLCGLSFVVMFLKRPIFLLLQAALILACVGFCQACEWAATNGHLVRKDGVKDGRWKEPFAALNAAVLLFNCTACVPVNCRDYAESVPPAAKTSKATQSPANAYGRTSTKSAATARRDSD